MTLLHFYSDSGFPALLPLLLRLICSYCIASRLDLVRFTYSGGKGEDKLLSHSPALSRRKKKDDRELILCSI